jgi:hypothetical protein
MHRRSPARRLPIFHLLQASTIARIAHAVAGLASKPTTGSATFSDASVENRPVFSQSLSPVEGLRPQIGTKDDVNSAFGSFPAVGLALS